MLHIHADLTYNFRHQVEVLLLIEAARSGEQTVHSDRLVIEPDSEVTRRDDLTTGEQRVIFSALGDVRIRYDADVSVRRQQDALQGIAPSPIRDLPGEVLKYLRASRYCPSDRFEVFCRSEFGHTEGGDRVQAILDWIGCSLSYEAGVSDGHSTAFDTFVDRAGVCRDFTHLAITLCRASDIPARAVSAHAYGLDPPDMHAVAEVFIGGRWRLVDPTGKTPVEGLVRVATGLDAADIAFMTIFGEATLVHQTFTISQS